MGQLITDDNQPGTDSGFTRPFDQLPPRKLNEIGRDAVTDDTREANRVACIAEAMNIMRTLCSNKIIFNVAFAECGISFTFSPEETRQAIKWLPGKIAVSNTIENGLIFLTW